MNASCVDLRNDLVWPIVAMTVSVVDVELLKERNIMEARKRQSSEQRSRAPLKPSAFRGRHKW